MDSLKDITPEDLFPGVAYSITEDDGDEDMPYTRPVRPRPKEDVGEVAVDNAAGMRKQDRIHHQSLLWVLVSDPYMQLAQLWYMPYSKLGR
jgi:hypothetical protein